MEVEVLHDKEQLQSKVIGLLIKSEREKRGITASYIATNLGISRQYISEIEHGNRNISYAMIDKILKYLDIKFEYKYSDIVLNEFYSFLKYYYIHEIEQAKQKLQIIINNCYFRYTFDYSTIILCEFIQSNLNRRKQELSLDFIIYLREELYTPFFYFKAHEYRRNREYYKSLECIEQAIKYIRHLKVSFRFIGLIYFLKALVLDDMYNYIESIKYNEKARKEFMRDYSIENALYSMLHQAISYANLGFFKEAMKLYDEILDKSYMVKNKEIVKMVKYNVFTCFFLAERYDEIYSFFIKYMKNDKEPFMGEEYLTFNEEIKIMLSKVFYELGDMKRSLSYFKRINIKNVEDQFMKNFMSIHKYSLLHDMKCYEKALHKCFNEISENDIIHTKIFILKHMMNFYEDVKDYENAYTYAKMIFEIKEEIKK